MSLFCPGVSWGRRRKTTVREPSDSVSVNSSVPCLCGRAFKTEDKDHLPSPNEDGGVSMDRENNNKPLSFPSCPDSSIAYFDNTLLAEQGTLYNKQLNTEAGTSSNPTGIFIPSWIRNRRYLPTIDDVDINQIDSISLDSYQYSDTEVMRDSPHMPLSPIRGNSDNGAFASKGLIYSSTPIGNNIFSKSNEAPQVMVTETASRDVRNGNRLGSVTSEVISPDTRSPNPRILTSRLSFNESLEQRRLEKHFQSHRNETMKSSLLENVVQNDTTDTISANAVMRRPSFPRQNVKFDLRRRVLTRNFCQKAIPEANEDIESSTDSDTSSSDNDQIDEPRYANNSTRRVNLSSNQEYDSDTSSTVSPASSEEYYSTEMKNLKAQKRLSFESDDGRQYSESFLHSDTSSLLSDISNDDIDSGTSVQQMHESYIPANVINASFQSNHDIRSIVGEPLLEEQERSHLPSSTWFKHARNVLNERTQTLTDTYVVIKDHKAEEVDECNVHVGDVVFVSSKNQRTEQIDWMWVMVAETGNLGYIPAFSARPVDLQSSIV